MACSNYGLTPWGVDGRSYSKYHTKAKSTRPAKYIVLNQIGLTPSGAHGPRKSIIISSFQPFCRTFFGEVK
eukprot:scaffold98_cov172-Amphora_coffeaeformis.AAC.6